MHHSAMPTVSALFSGPVSVGLLAGVVSGLFYLVVAGIRWAGVLIWKPSTSLMMMMMLCSTIESSGLRAVREREQLRLLSLRQPCGSADGGTGDGADDHGDFNARWESIKPATSRGERADRAAGWATPPLRRAAERRRARSSAAERRRAPRRTGNARLHAVRLPAEVKQQSEEWLFRQVQRRLHPTSSDRRLCSTENGVGMEPESVRVREFIESLVESLLSGELDNHMAAQDSPSAAHAALKQLVHQIIQEAMVLPKFNGVKPTEDDMKSLGDMESKTYEDILATAILNKVIERYQQRDSSGRASLDGNSNLLSPELMSLVAMYQPRLLSYSESGVSHMRSSDDYDSIEECIEEVTTFSNADEEENDIDPDSYLPGLDIFKNRRAPFPEYGRDIIDGPPLELSDNEEGEDEVASEDEDSMQPTDIINPVDSWEENWLFQKRRLKVGGVPQPMPVPMLVPNPSEDYRALIGDRDAEDVSDLSDCSDGALEDVVLAEEDTSSIPVTATTPSNVLNTQENVASTLYDNHLSSRKDVNPAKTSEASSEHADKARMIMNEDNKKATYDIRELTEAKNMEYLKSTEDCLSEFGQQEGEYTEDYAAVTRRQMDSLTAMSDLDTTEVPELPSTPIPQLNSDTSTVDESVVAILDGLVPGESDTDQLSLTSLGSIELTKPPRPGTDHLDDEYCTLPAAGTIAEREHKKWETAPPIPNNPYSSENIIKRLNKNHPYIRTDSSSEALMEFLESKEVLAEKVVEQPLQVICSPSDVDFKRYGRDYYINAQPVANSVKKQTSSQPSQQQVSDATFLSVAKLEKQILNRDVYHSSFRARHASPNFTMNPLYKTEKENMQQKENVDNIQCNYNRPFEDLNLEDYDLSHQMIEKLDLLETNSLAIVTSVDIIERFQKNPLFTLPPNKIQLCQVLCISNNTAAEDDVPNKHPENKALSSQMLLNYHVRTKKQKRENVCTESGYSSSLDSLNDPSAYLLRLTPPSQPQMVERTFESLTSIRRSGSLRVDSCKRKEISGSVMGGSLRINRRRNTPAKELCLACFFITQMPVTLKLDVFLSFILILHLFTVISTSCLGDWHKLHLYTYLCTFTAIVAHDFNCVIFSSILFLHLLFNSRDERNNYSMYELSRGNDAQLEVPSINEDSTETQDPNNIETKVALWQKEINETDQYYKNILNKKQEHAQDSPSSDSDHQTDSSSFYKSMLSNGNENHDNDENENNKSKSKNKLRERLREFEKIERNGFDDIEEKSAVFIKTKTDSKLRREAGFEILGTLRRNSNIGSTLSLNENGTDFYSNGYARSESPSGSSVLTSDSDFGMPSVKELTKRFSGVVDSDSSASPKSVSPAPQWRKTEKPQKWGNNEMKMQSQAVPSTLSPPRPVREIHSLTARSISKEFREELRHNQPVPLNKNVYKQMNPKHLNGMDNGIEEENSSSSYTRISSESKSPVPHRSMQSSIAFWEQMQKNKS
ncbi:Uncharacterized protein GBIM_17274 [Gryllus bimaculatus]|nr:Uncharacterized protein GBIM_17274 [Gryllus bimaculatus]